MPWHDGFLEAAFRGVPFHIKSSDYKFGSNAIDHTFPRREDTETEIINGLPDKFTLNAYLLGADYFSQRDRFERALKQTGVGILVHSYRGVLNVKITGEISARETDSEGGMIRYQIPITIVDIVKKNQAGIDTVWICRGAKDSIVSAAKEQFFNLFDLAGKPASAIRDARGAMDQGLSVINDAKTIASSAADFKREIENTRGRIDALAFNLEYLVDSFADLADWGLEEATLEDSRKQFRELKEVTSFRGTIIGEIKDQSDSYTARLVQDLIAQFSIASRVGLIARVDFDSFEDAVESKGELFDDIDEISNVANTDLFAALRDGRYAAQTDVDSRILTFPRFVDKKLSNGTNSLSLMWTLYGDLEKEQSFLDRNQIEHPGFIPAGKDLKIQLNDV